MGVKVWEDALFRSFRNHGWCVVIGARSIIHSFIHSFQDGLLKEFPSFLANIMKRLNIYFSLFSFFYGKINPIQTQSFLLVATVASTR